MYMGELDRYSGGNGARQAPSPCLNSILSLFIDELGNFNMQDHHGALYGFCLVLHDQSAPINEHLDKLHASLTNSGYNASLPLHTAPIIRMKDPYDAMSREERRAIFNKFLGCLKGHDPWRHFDMKYPKYAN